MYNCLKCGGKISQPQVEPDFKPYTVRYIVAGSDKVTLVVYAVNEEHAREMAPCLSFQRPDGSSRHLNILDIKPFPII